MLKVRKNWAAMAAGVAVLGMLIAAGARQAKADSITFDLGAGNTGLSGYTGPYASVEVTLTNSTTATITFTSYNDGTNTYLLGDGGTVGVNVNATSWTLGSIVGSNAGTGFTPGPYSNGGSGNEDGWGSFNQTINTFDGYTHSSDTITFTITNNSGTWLFASDVLTANANGYFAGAHIFVCADQQNGNCDASVSALTTGFATDVPEPATLTLLGTGLLVLAGAARRAMFRS